MSQVTIVTYTCDQCKALIKNTTTGKLYGPLHIEIEISAPEHTGYIASVDFCSVDCAGEWIRQVGTK